MNYNFIHPKRSKIRIFATVLLLSACLHSFAQQKNNNKADRDAQHKIESLKRDYLSRQLRLSSGESQKFWPVYDQYQKDMRQIIRERRQNRVHKNNLKNASDRQIEQYMNKDFNLQQQALQLREQYREKFRKVIPPHKVMQLYKSEKDFNMKLVRELHRRENKNHNQPPGRSRGNGNRQHPLK